MRGGGHAAGYRLAVRVNASIPGTILTHAWDDVTSEGLADAAGNTALGRLGEAHEAASVELSSPPTKLPA